MRFLTLLNKTVVILLFSVISLWSQSEIEVVREKFREFEYNKVIELADGFLAEDNADNKTVTEEVYVLKAVSHFSIAQEDSARRTFFKLLKLNNRYMLNPVEYSPKIIDFFNGVKEEYNLFSGIDVQAEDDKTESDSQMPSVDSKTGGALWRSILLPGWGHLHKNNGSGGWILTILSTATLGSAVYFSIDAASKEKAYLNESAESEIENKYKEYNTAYRLRNLSYTAYALLWGYSQIDLVFYADKNISLGLQSERVNTDMGYFLSMRYEF